LPEDDLLITDGGADPGGDETLRAADFQVMLAA
jgi:hypothetical protein